MKTNTLLRRLRTLETFVNESLMDADLAAHFTETLREARKQLKENAR